MVTKSDTFIGNDNIMYLKIIHIFLLLFFFSKICEVYTGF